MNVNDVLHPDRRCPILAKILRLFVPNIVLSSGGDA